MAVAIATGVSLGIGLGTAALSGYLESYASKINMQINEQNLLIQQTIAETQDRLGRMNATTNDILSREQAKTADMLSRSIASTDLAMQTNQIVAQESMTQAIAMANAKIEMLNGNATAMEMRSDFNRTMASNMVTAAAQGRRGGSVEALADAAENQFHWEADYAKAGSAIKAFGFESQAAISALKSETAKSAQKLGFADIPLAGTSGAPLAGTSGAPWAGAEFGLAATQAANLTGHIGTSSSIIGSLMGPLSNMASIGGIGELFGSTSSGMNTNNGSAAASLLSSGGKP